MYPSPSHPQNFPEALRKQGVTVLGSFRETALIVEAGLTGDYVPARV
jgi:hypothetical protein